MRKLYSNIVLSIALARPGNILLGVREITLKKRYKNIKF